MVHIGIIPDGNRRWFKQNNINYKLENLEEVWFNILVDQLREISLNKYEYLEKLTSLSFYICSIENIRREDNTSKYIYIFLEKLFYFYENYCEIIDSVYKNDSQDKINKTKRFLNELFNNLNIIPIGELNILPENIYDGLIKIKSNNKESNKYNLYLAIAYDFETDLLNYGTKQNENYNREQTNIDIVLRSGGELRLSGFFPAHINYAEFFYYKKYWPEITVKDMNNVVCEFLTKRNRRFGK
ncbi:hypothetical protein CL656_04770 [bacterium]|nr:hypothetical protein [bacterium]|tara:strand:- start:4838 stop:5563 length:726 start_codon:yes stop_codon:yes gene_type:complete